MHLTITQKFLAAALARGAAVAEKAPTIVVLANVRLKAEGGRLAVATTDLDRFAEATVDANVIEPGVITVPAAALVTLINKHPKDGEVTLQLEGSTLLVRCGRSKVKLPTLPAEDFPQWADEKPVAEFVLGGSTFARIFNRVRFAVSSEEARYYLQGICFDVDKAADTLSLVATDGHRLAVSSIALPEGAESCPRAIVPTEAVDAALRIFKSAGEVAVAFTERSVTFAADDLRLCSKVIDGEFPQYLRVIPARGAPAIKFMRADFVDCLDRANVLAGDGATHGAIVAEPGPGSLRLKASNHFGGSAEEELAADIAPEVERFGFNPRYAADFLKTLAVEELVFEQSGAGGPILILSPQAPDFTGVLMPMRV